MYELLWCVLCVTNEFEGGWLIVRNEFEILGVFPEEFEPRDGSFGGS